MLYMLFVVYPHSYVIDKQLQCNTLKSKSKRLKQQPSCIAIYIRFYVTKSFLQEYWLTIVFVKTSYASCCSKCHHKLEF